MRLDRGMPAMNFLSLYANGFHKNREKLRKIVLWVSIAFVYLCLVRAGVGDPSLNLYCLHVLSARDTIQTSNKTQDFELLHFDSAY